MNSGLFYREKPLFGLDIGHSNLKVMQLRMENGHSPRVVGYGANRYPAQAIANGVIVDFKALNQSLYDLLNQNLSGAITSKRVACTIPASRTFSRPMKLPPMDNSDVVEAVQLEAEQYIPIPVANLYIDYDIIRRDQTGVELLMVATPKNIIDSYVKFMQAVGLEPVALEPTMNAAGRLFSIADPSSKQPSLLIDFGSIAVDLAVFDQTLFVNSTVQGGSDTITDLISKHLGISQDEAYGFKNQHGIKDTEHKTAIMEAIGPMLDNLIREIKKILRYYHDRREDPQHKIGQIITVGGGVNMPGLNEYLSDQLGLPSRMLDPWSKIDFGQLPPPGDSDRSMYITVAGEAVLNPRGIFA